MKNKQEQPIAKNVVYQQQIDPKPSVTKPLESVSHQKQIDADVELQKRLPWNKLLVHLLI